MAEVYIIHRNEGRFDEPIVFRREVDADQIATDFTARDNTAWIKRKCTIQETKAAFEAERMDLARERALAKLTEEEKEALGV